MPTWLTAPRCPRLRITARLVLCALACCVAPSLAARSGADDEPVPPPASPRLDVAFRDWVRTARNPSYRELTERFLRAAGKDPESYRATMSDLESRFRAMLERDATQPEPIARVRALARFLFEEVELRASEDVTALEQLYPDEILVHRRGYCVGLSLIVLELGERLGWPLVAMPAPRHVYVRYDDGEAQINFETTRGGESLTDAWYREHYGQEKTPSPLSPRSFAAHLLNNHGCALLQQGKIADARAEFDQALSLDANLAEALVNQGVALGQSGEFAKAREAFERAQRIWPKDGRLELNRLEAWLATGQDLRECALAALRFAVDYPEAPIASFLRSLRSRLHPEQDWEAMQLLSAQVAARVLREGKTLGWTGHYHGGRDFEKELRVRHDPKLEFNWRWQSPGRGLPRDNFSVRWEGFLETPKQDEYTFLFFCSDGVRLWIDGRPVVDAWIQTVDNVAQGKVTLRPGFHEVRVDYFESNGDAGILMMLAAETREDMLDLSQLVFTSSSVHTDPPKK